jgi:hypothetical protein
MAVYAILEIVHADFCPGSFTSVGEAEAALTKIIESDPEARGRFDIVELDEEGFPVGEITPSPSRPILSTR